MRRVLLALILVAAAGCSGDASTAQGVDAIVGDVAANGGALDASSTADAAARAAAAASCLSC